MCAMEKKTSLLEFEAEKNVLYAVIFCHKFWSYAMEQAYPRRSAAWMAYLASSIVGVVRNW